MIGFRATGKEIGGQIELELTDGPFKGTSFYFESMKFADEENDDGSLNMEYEYTITSSNPPKKLSQLEVVLGELLMQIMEDQLKKNEIIYTGGTDEKQGPADK